MTGVAMAALMLAVGADVNDTVRETLDCDAFGVFDGFGHCSHIVEDFERAQDLARMNVFYKRRGNFGEVIPMIRVSQGHYRKMERAGRASSGGPA